MAYARSNSVVYQPQSGDRLWRAGRLWFAVFFAYKKILGRTETRTRDRIWFQTIRLVRDIFPGRSSKNSDLQFANGDRFKANYSVKKFTKSLGGMAPVPPEYDTVQFYYIYILSMPSLHLTWT